MNHSIRCTEFNHIVANKNITLFSNNTIAIPQQYYGKEYLQILETENGIEYRNNKKEREGIKALKMTVYPNPVIDLLKVFVYSIPLSRNFSISIRTIDGKEVSNTNILSGESMREIDVKNLNGGVYSIILKDGNEILDVQKLVIY